MKASPMTAELSISIGQFSDKGRKENNQDCHGAFIPQDSLLALKGIVVAMADGISSSQTSHIASQTAVRTFIDDYYCTSEAWSVKNSFERVLAAINSWLYSKTMAGDGRYEKDKGYVSTFSALVFKHRSAHVFHVGDTRIYRLNHNGLEQLTHDHRLWANDTDSYLSRALGVEQHCPFDHQTLTINVGDVFIMCTDGLYEFLPANVMIDAVQQADDLHSDLDQVAQSLVKQAYDLGSDDNVSLQIVRIEALADDTGLGINKELERLALPPVLEARREFEGYLILTTLHSNSRSRVYLAEDIITKKKVVIKTPASDIENDAEHLERFLLEEWVARRINNPHVLKADLADRERQSVYTVFEYIEGQTLAQWAQDNPKPSLEIVRGFIEQIGKGLNAFHKMDMLHQDLRPENIMIDQSGILKIIDFGSVSIAGLQEATSDIPDTYLLGTALYSAPEYFLAEAGTTQSELFSLGVITYFLLSGDYPYGTKVARTKTIAAQRKLHYKSLMAEDRDIPSWVDDAIRKAVSPLPERRQQDVFEYLHDLRKPNKAFVKKTKPPLIERDPVAFWQGTSFALVLVIIYLLTFIA
ncbi:MAG: serine/threonine protein phosphatase PrpC/tRNA A-37 threonylcarbamoyl transferase component Bud32 [Oleispira sp.]|jgi:serine/threonine protein phosphatase PrpC/tRNA A-37 threonylcarbamoyl transferase component Bud32|tara:strand:- start:4981 stop:6732 length:1752 start_codon:yes stop_codon:yes gene_type:complete